jgi:hypothetical protein
MPNPLTSMDNVLVVQIVNCLKDLLDRLRGVFLGEFALVTNPIEQLSACR